ncbi:DNA mismatch repair protein MutS, partial [candidate division WWE3 bacterium]|nr:DNA mismatch repair protein MutS [candidate division WWE3 bacterium]
MSQKQDIVVEYNGLEFSTPMMVQYVELKEKYPDCLIFFRLGDFYELFLEDAQIGAKVLGITLTSRSRGKDGRIPMAGVPYHAVDNYLSKLVKEGHKVAIAEQLSDPSVGDLVQRDIVRIVTPGTLLDEKVLDSKQNNYVAALQIDPKSVGFSFADVTTGTFHTSQFGYENLEKVLADQFTKFSPSECILPEESYNNPIHLKAIKNVSDVNIYPFSTWNNVANSSSNAGKFLKDHFNIKSLDAFSMEDSDSSVKSSAALLAYLKETQKDQVSHVKKISNFASSEFVHLDRSTIFNLELFRTIRDGGKKGSLVDTLDRTSTPMGARLLRDWIIKPLVNKSKLEARFDFIDELINKFQIRRSLIEDLSKMNDIERILSRATAGSWFARDLLNIRDTLNLCLKIKSNLDLLSVPIAKELGSQISSDLDTVSKIITKAITPDPPIDLKIGGLINAGVSKELDELKGSISNSTDWLAKLEEVERKATGISTLRVGFNKVFGYYIEVTKSNSPLVPDRYVRKQTLVNAERYITNEL